MPHAVPHSKLEEILKTQSNLGAVLTMTMPTIVSQLITIVYNYADSIYVGLTNDPNQVAAIAIALPLSITMTAMSNFWGVGGGSAFSRALGADDLPKARRVAAFSIYAATISTLVLSVLAGTFITEFTSLLGATEGVLQYANAYFFWLFVVGGVPTVLSMVLAHFARAGGYAKQAGIGLTIGGLLNIILDPLFIFPFGLGMGVAGAALATMLSNVASVVYFCIFFATVRKQSHLSFSPLDAIPQLSNALEIMSVGLPSALLMLLSAISNCVLNSLVAQHGTHAIAAVGIAKKLDSLPVHISIGTTQGVLPLLAYTHSAGMKEKLKGILYTTLKLAFTSLFALVLILEIFARPMAMMFIQDEQTIVYATSFIRILCLSVPLYSISTTINTCFQAMNRSKIAFILSLIRKGFLDIPLMFLFNALFEVTNIIWVQPIMDVVLMIISLVTVKVYFARQRP